MSHLAVLKGGINTDRKDILSILDHILVIISQKLKPTLLNLSDLKLLLIKLESQLVSHTWKGKKKQYMYMFMKFQFFMLLDTLYVVLHVPLVNKLLKFNL